MDDTTTEEQAIELLQQLGLKEYEAKSFVALARREHGTAKNISETSDVPRTRVYDAVRVLESKGLVETQHSNPQVFRAVSIDEAVETLQSEFVERTESLRSALSELEPTDDEEIEEVTHEVWAISGRQGIAGRTQRLIDDATEEVILVVGHESAFDQELTDQLRRARDRGVDVYVGAGDEHLESMLREELPDVEVFVSGLEWLGHSPLPGDHTEIGRLLLTDRESILVSSVVESESPLKEQAVFGRGFDNGLVAIVRRLMATGLQLEGEPREQSL